MDIDVRPQSARMSAQGGNIERNPLRTDARFAMLQSSLYFVSATTFISEVSIVSLTVYKEQNYRDGLIVIGSLCEG